MEAGSWAGIVSLIVVVVREIINAINHKRLRSNCCGKESVVSVDIENTTPPKKEDKPQLEIKAPTT